MVKKNFGTLYVGKFPISPGFKYDGPEEIRIGDTVGSCEIQWIQTGNGLLIADRCICSNISWDQLNEQDLVFGTFVEIDGKNYLCRCLKVGRKDTSPNEWIKAVDRFGSGDSLWHCKNMYFWGQETFLDEPNCRIVRGQRGPRFWSFSLSNSRKHNIGFRPALEPVAPIPEDFAPLLDTTVAPMGPDKTFVSGKLVSVSDYDLVLEHPSAFSGNSKWVMADGKYAIIDRASINWLKEV